MKRLVAFVLAAVLMAVMLAGTGLAGAAVPGQMYYSISAGQLFITGIEENAPNCILPERMEGYDVAGIAENALWGNAAIRSLWIPESVTQLPDNLLAGRDDLTLVVQEGSYAHAWAQEHGAQYVTAQAVEGMLGYWFRPGADVNVPHEFILRENGEAQITLDGDTQILPWYAVGEGLAVMMDGTEATISVNDDGDLVVDTGDTGLLRFFRMEPLTLDGFLSGVGEYLMSLLNGKNGYSLTWTVDMEQDDYQDSYTYSIGVGEGEEGGIKVVFAEGEEPEGLMTFRMDDEGYKLILPDETIKGSYDQIVNRGLNETDLIALIAQAFTGDAADKTIEFLSMLWEEIEDTPKVRGMIQTMEAGGEAEINLNEAGNLLMQAIKGLSVNQQAIELLSSHPLVNQLGVPTKNRSTTIMGFMRLLAGNDMGWRDDVFLRIGRDEGELRLELFADDEEYGLTISEQAGGLRLDFYFENFRNEFLPAVLEIRPAADGWDIQGSLSGNKGLAQIDENSFGVDSMSISGKIDALRINKPRAELYLTSEYEGYVSKLAIRAAQVLDSAAEGIEAFRAVMMEQLESGDAGKEVYRMQERLRELGYLGIKPTNRYGSITEEAVKEFQSAIGHPETGIATVEMQRILYSADAPRYVPKATPTPTINPLDDIETIQARLIELEWLDAEHKTGVYDAATEQAVRSFKVYLNSVNPNAQLLADGNMEEDTYAWLMWDWAPARPTPTPKPTATPTPKPTPEPIATPYSYRQLELGDTGEAVYRMQERLHELGYLGIKPTNRYGSITEDAVKEFQRAVGYSETGIATVEMQRLLYSASAPYYVPSANPTPKPVVVEVEDRILELCIRDILKKPNGDLTTADLEKVTRISIIGEKVTDTSALSYCKNLQALALIDCGLTAMPDLSGLDQLSWLELNQNEIRQIKKSHTDGLDSLTYIALYQNPLTNVSGLATLREDAFIDMIDESKNENPYVNDVVRQIQALLIEKNYLVDISDGSFGPKAEAAVKELQADAGLPQTGMFDQETLRALIEMPEKEFEPTQKRQIVIYNAYRGEDGMVYFKVKNTGSEPISEIQIAGRQLDYNRKNVGSLNGKNGENYYTYWSWGWEDDPLEGGEAGWCRISGVQNVPLRPGAYYANLWRYSLTTADGTKIQLYDNSQEPTSTIEFKFVK